MSEDEFVVVGCGDGSTYGSSFDHREYFGCVQVETERLRHSSLLLHIHQRQITEERLDFSKRELELLARHQDALATTQ